MSAEAVRFSRRTVLRNASRRSSASKVSPRHSGFAVAFRQNPKWALENFQLQPTKMLIALALLIPANWSDG